LIEGGVIMEKIISKLESFLTIEILVNLGKNFLLIVGILLVSRLLIKLSFRFIDSLLIKSKQKYINERRTKTIQMLMKSISRYGIYFFAILTILSILNVPVGSLVAGAGILGVALGFGAQNLVKDIINGFFILFEDQFGVGDYIETAGVDGVVEEIGLRTTSIRSFGGELHIVPNSEISQVSNYSNGSMRVMIDVGVSYDENPARVMEALEFLCTDIAKEKSDIITEGPKVLGVQDLAESSVVFRIWAKVLPMEQWQMGRYIKQRIKETLDEEGVEIPYPHMVLMTGKEKGVVSSEG